MLFTQAMANVITAMAASHLYPDMEPKGDLPDRTVKTLIKELKTCLPQNLVQRLLIRQTQLLYQRF